MKDLRQLVEAPSTEAQLVEALSRTGKAVVSGPAGAYTFTAKGGIVVVHDDAAALRAAEEKRARKAARRAAR
jgi:hypothetical protein